MGRAFRDRADAGRQLAERIALLELEPPVVFGLARGGVAVAAELAAHLEAPWDVFVASKIGAPGQEELGVGALAEGLGEPLVSGTARAVGLSPEDVIELAGGVRQELARRVSLYRNGRPVVEVEGRDAVLVDDGLATGITAEAALLALRALAPRRLALAAPVCSRPAYKQLAGVADDVICLEVPTSFFAVGQWYQDFRQTTDDEVLQLLARRSRLG